MTMRIEEVPKLLKKRKRKNRTTAALLAGLPKPVIEHADYCVYPGTNVQIPRDPSRFKNYFYKC